MNVVGNWLLSLLAFLFAFWFWSSSEIGSSEVSPPSLRPTPVAKGTATGQRVFPLPPGKTIVVDAKVNRGPLPPEYQGGYEMTIDGTGHVVITVTPEGTYAATPTAKQEVSTREIGVAGLQALLNRLEQGGYFRLNQLRGAHGGRVGGPGDIITVTLADGTWTMSGSELSPSAELQLERMQGWIVEAVGFQLPADLLPGATPAP